ncbi:hypothetical protein HY639_01885 [Candidatus Woesearchaeota archaeon]|nr:hypothetical protein [Candidatus Woesearchaeota archaeon]
MSQESISSIDSLLETSEKLKGKCWCGSGMDGDVTVCPACDTPFHVECWNDISGCARYGCKERGKKLDELAAVGFASSDEEKVSWYQRIRNFFFGESSKILCNGLLWEAKSNGLSYYNVSDARLEKCGLRHPSPAEYFGVICLGLEGKLSGPARKLYEDMQSDWGLWFNQAYQNKNGVLVFYENPKGVYWETGGYHSSNMTWSNVKEYGLGLPAGWHSLWEIAKRNPQLVKDFWSRDFEELPSIIQTRGGLWIAHDGLIWPVGRDGCGNWYDLNGDYVSWASRGVASSVGKKITTGKKN